MLKFFLFAFVILSFNLNFSFSQQASKRTDYTDYRKFSSSKPSIEVSYGISGLTLNSNSFNLANEGLIELRLGYAKQKQSSYGKNILNYTNGFLFLSNSSSQNAGESNSVKVQSQTWKFGFGRKEGYGVKLSNDISILPYTSNSYAWSRFDYDPPADSAAALEYNALTDFNEAFRFGNTTEGGINIQLSKGFSIQPKYEITDVFPRTLFGKMLMSNVIEIGGLYLLDSFTKNILKNAPVAGTFINFILKNAYEYGFYELCRNQMNWPFTSVAPLRYFTFKIGTSFTF